jgi:hypothetical protein
MLAPNVRTDGMLVAPQLSTRGPVQPEDRIAVRLPLRAILGADLHDEVVVHFHADGAVCDPSRVPLGVLRAGESIVAQSTATILPLNGHRDVRVWAEVEIGQKRLMTEDALAPIVARSRLSLEATDDGTEVRLTLRNDGQAPTEVRFETIGSGVPTADDLVLREDRAGRAVSEPVTIGVGEVRAFALRGARVDHIIAVGADGERAPVQPRRVSADVALRIEPELRIDAPEHGVRRGDLVTFHLTLRNKTASAVNELRVNLDRVSDLALISDTISLDSVRVIPDDIREHPDVISVLLGRLEPDAEVVLRGALRVQIENPRLIDAIPITGSVAAPRLPTYRFEGETLVDRRPAFAPTTTYLTAIEPDGEAFRIRGLITNAEPYRLERLRVRLDVSDAVPNDHVDVDHREPILLRPTALDDSASLFADLGGLDPGERVGFSLGLRPARGDSDFRTMRVRAALQVDDDLVELGDEEFRVPGRSTLDRSSLQRQDDRALRLGMPCEAILEIRNDGDSPARDVRLCLDLPPSVGASVPEAAAGARWRTIAAVLPPGSVIATTITFFLLEPPTDPHAIVRASIDAEGHAEVDFDAVTFATPTDPLVDPPALQVQPLDDGRIAFFARVANVGDGAARGVTVRVENPEYIMARMTAVDSVLVDDVGPHSALAEALSLGDLAPGAFRDVTWYTAPTSDAPYTTTVAVSYEGLHEAMRATSVPTKPRIVPALSSSLPEPRRLTGGVTAERTPRRTLVRVVEEAAGSALGPAPRADALAANDSLQAALPWSTPPVAQPPAVDNEQDQRTPALADGSATATAASSASTEGHDGAETPFADAERTKAEVHALATSDDVAGPAASGGTGEPPAPRPDAAAAASVQQSADALPIAPSPVPEVASEDNEPTAEPVKPVLRISFDRPTGAAALAIAGKIVDTDALGWWRHILAMRVFLAESLPAEVPADIQTAYTEMRRLLNEPIKTVFGPIFADGFVPDEAWIDALSANDEAALVALDIVLAGLPAIKTSPIATGSVRLDNALPHFLPDVHGSPEIDECLGFYKQSAVRLFGYDGIVKLTEAARRDKYSGAPNATLDDRLRNIVRAAEEL